ncbi:MAG TPA: MFS transporter [bacterium]|nr:MFS transporter [bacterium]
MTMASSVPGVQQWRVEPQAARVPIAAGAVGTVIEWYDFAVYAYFASFLGSNFFPSTVPYRSLLLSFAVFGVGFFMRPVGGFVFGHYGDKIGRRNALAATIILMGIATFLVGVLPTYGQIGIAAPILLVILRLFQGFSAGGEWAGAAAFLVEYAPPGRRGFIGSWQQVSVGGGFLLGSAGATLLASIMSPESLAGWGWRIPFLSGLVMTAIGLYLRLAVEETPKFRAIQKAGQVADAPIAEAFGKHGKRLLTVVGFTLSGTVAYYVFLAYFPNYVSTVLKLPLRTASSVNTIGLILFLIMVPFLGVLSDRIGRRPLLLAHAAAAAILAYPLFLLMESRSFGAILIAQIIGVAIQGLFSGAAVAGYVEMFPTRIRYTAISVPYNITVAAFGGTAPFIATYLVSTTGNHLSFTYYLMAAGIISFLTYLLVVKETCWSELQ